MPVFCYETEDGAIHERIARVGKAPRRITVAGKSARRALYAEIKCSPPVKGWPLTCVGSGVHPDQAGELRDHLASHGVPTEVTPAGDPVYRNAMHRRKALKVRGMHDNASFC